MHILDIFATQKTTLSFEFFPPKSDEASEELFVTIQRLQELKPSFVSVTYGAGGSTRDRTHQLVTRIIKETSLTAISHLTSVCHSQEELATILDRYAESGVENILALRGDPPRGMANYNRDNDAFKYASELVQFIRSRQKQPDPRGFGIGVAGFPEGHPDTRNRIVELDNLKRKVDSGADYICTQMFFDNHDFHDFRERCEIVGIKIPIIAGIMPIASRAGMIRMSELSPGTRIPAKLLKAIGRCTDDESVAKVGIHHATEQCRDLLDHQVKGLHFYTLNKSDATRQIYASLGINDSTTLR